MNELFYREVSISKILANIYVEKRKVVWYGIPSVIVFDKDAYYTLSFWVISI